MGSRDHLFKVLVVGDAAVGKTSLVQRYSQDSFSKHYKSTVGGKMSRPNRGAKRPGPHTGAVVSSGVGDSGPSGPSSGQDPGGDGCWVLDPRASLRFPQLGL